MKLLIDADYFEHLLACLANQKFIGEPPPNGDALSIGEKKYLKIQSENQKIIDIAWRKGMDILWNSSFSAKGGIARAKSLSAKRRKEIATLASHSRPKKPLLTNKEV